MPGHGDLLAGVPDRFLYAAAVLVAGIIIGLLVARLNRALLSRAGVPEAVEGTAFERTMRRFGSSTVSVIATLSMWFIIGIAVMGALSVADVNVTQQFWARVTGFLPELFFAILVLIVGNVVGDKLELMVSDRLRGVKLPQIGILPRLVKYSVIYLAILIALGQIGVATSSLIVLLGVYALALVVGGTVAFRDLLRSGAAGIYLLLNEPYSIGDEIRVGSDVGVVQEVSILVTRIEDDEAEYIIPNHRFFEEGVVRTLRE